MRTPRMLVLATATLTAAGMVTAVPAAAAPQGGTAAAAETASGEQTMQVVAHEDDDLFFMNPDIDRTIAAGVPTVTVFVTAGQKTGDPAGGTDEQRARNRQRGIQNAYATMAGVADGDDDTQDEWSGAVLTLAGKSVERYVLNSRPTVSLIFMNLHDGFLDHVDAGEQDATVVPDRGQVATSFRYTRTDVVSVLGALMRWYGVTVLRAQDPVPDRRDGYGGDHADHIAGARMVADAAAGYTSPLYEVNYRDYNIGDVPANLDQADADRKAAIVDQYYRYDQGFKNSHSGDVWLSRMYYRWSRGANWVAQNLDGRPQAFVVRNGAVYTYWMTASGGWAGPLRLADPGGRVAPGLAVGRNADGRLEVFALVLTGDDQHRYQVVSLPQTEPNGGFRSYWAYLGNPNDLIGQGNRDLVGTPAVTSNGDGRLQLFIKNGGGGVSSLWQTTPNGGWYTGGWEDLGGTDVQDGLAAVRNPDGRIEVFASTRSAILQWYQHEQNAGLIRNEQFPGGQPASPPNAELDEGGRIEVAYRQPGTEHMLVAFQTEVGGAWYDGAVDIGGQGGIGQPGMILSPRTTDGRIMIFERNRGTGVSTAHQTGPNLGYGEWSDLGGVVLDYPAAVTDGHDRAVVFTIGTNGMYARRQVDAGGDQAFGPWEPLGF